MAQIDHTPEPTYRHTEEPRTGASTGTTFIGAALNTNTLDLIGAAVGAGLILVPLLVGAVSH
ncbi:hypothetical protein [Salinarimonas soli]|uniref:Uncharacterized protein n=1 Tax=Salinarimonas soli TaxID=1638099 RepID=A0A5B2VAB7_9HYPH|nr:hypothetical protein [Salinarimonas soli]KAA2235934.1 hypothetical protein F0L46_17370 [Salinarimonas soli]